VFIKTSEHL